MVKLRGINIYPTSLGVILTESDAELLNEYICIVTRLNGRDEMVLRIETVGKVDREVFSYERLLKERLGVEIRVELASPGELSQLTQIERRQKPIRLIIKAEK
jgi:phenylacetate-CoA ligase